MHFRYIKLPLSFVLTLQLILSLASVGVHGQTQNEACREPGDVIEIYRGLRRKEIERSGNEQPADLPILEAPASNDVMITALNRTCHHRRRATSCECRTRHELNFDPNRLPKALIQSSCCSRNHHFTDNWMAECREIYHNVLVMRRNGCHEGIYQYVSQLEALPVGCSCHVVRRVHSAP